MLRQGASIWVLCSCNLLCAVAGVAEATTCPAAAFISGEAPVSGEICLTQDGQLLPYEEKASAPQTCFTISIQYGLPELGLMKLKATGTHPNTQLSVWVPEHEEICAAIAPMLFERLLDIRDIHVPSDDFLIYHEEIEKVSQAFIVISGRIFGNLGTLVDAAPENTRILRRQDLSVVALAEIFHPGALSLYDLDLVATDDVMPSLLDMVEARYLEQADDWECIGIIQTLAPKDWHISLRSDHIRFSPRLPRYGAYCAAVISITAEDAEPWLSPDGKDILSSY